MRETWINHCVHALHTHCLTPEEHFAYFQLEKKKKLFLRKEKNVPIKSGDGLDASCCWLTTVIGDVLWWTGLVDWSGGLVWWTASGCVSVDDDEGSDPSQCSLNIRVPEPWLSEGRPSLYGSCCLSESM
ncbi:uncharacterized protein V6R79_016332 [Siganus canaliculatus]